MSTVTTVEKLIVTVEVEGRTFRAEVDGANRIQQFFHIILPNLKGTTNFVVVINTIWAFQSFDLAYSMTRGGPGYGGVARGGCVGAACGGSAVVRGPYGGGAAARGACGPDRCAGGAIMRQPGGGLQFRRGVVER